MLTSVNKVVSTTSVLVQQTAEKNKDGSVTIHEQFDTILAGINLAKWNGSKIAELEAEKITLDSLVHPPQPTPEEVKAQEVKVANLQAIADVLSTADIQKDIV